MIKVTLVSYTRNPIQTIAEAASVCYDSEPSIKIVKGCIKSGHMSVIEHASFTFKIEGISRACGLQVVRHRIASYSQRSQRYTIKDDSDYVVPPSIESGGLECMNEYLLMMDRITSDYERLLNIVPAEDARMVLPNACPTIIYVSMNLRALSHFCNERMCTRAQWEIRKVAELMREAVLTCPDIKTEDEIDIINSLLVPKCKMLSFCPEQRGCGRVASLKKVYKDLEETHKENQRLKAEIENLKKLKDFVNEEEFYNISD